MSSYWFGPAPWGSVCDEGQRIATPVGASCLHCDEPIDQGDSGLIFLVYSKAGPRHEPLHRECAVRMIVGSVGHQKGNCRCFGGDESDPAIMTKRQAARASVAFFERRRL